MGDNISLATALPSAYTLHPAFQRQFIPPSEHDCLFPLLADCHSVAAFLPPDPATEVMRRFVSAPLPVDMRDHQLEEQIRKEGNTKKKKSFFLQVRVDLRSCRQCEPDCPPSAEQAAPAHTR